MSTIFSQALNAASTGGNGYTHVMRYTPAALTLPSDSIVRVRATFQANTGAKGFGITNSYIGHKAASGDAYDFASTPVQFLFSGSGSTTISASTSLASDWANFPYDKTSDLLIAWYFGDSSNDEMRYFGSSVTNVTSYYKSATNEAGTVNKTTGYTAKTNEYYGIASIEVETSSGGLLPFFFQ